LIGDGDFRVMLLQIQTNYDRNMAFIAFFQSLIRWSMCQGDLPDGLVGLPVTRFSLLQITATASLKAWSSFDWSQQLSQLSLRQVGSDFGILWCPVHLSSSQFIPVLRVLGICVDLHRSVLLWIEAPRIQPPPEARSQPSQPEKIGNTEGIPCHC
jgi:hypothetical protein